MLPNFLSRFIELLLQLLDLAPLIRNLRALCELGVILLQGTIVPQGLSKIRFELENQFDQLLPFLTGFISLLGTDRGTQRQPKRR